MVFLFVWVSLCSECCCLLQLCAGVWAKGMCFSCMGEVRKVQHLPGGGQFPALDPPAVGADISMGTRLCCLTEMQIRTCAFWDWKAEISHVVK